MVVEVQMLVIFLVASLFSLIYLLRLLEKKESYFADTLLDLREINEALLLDKEYSRQIQAEKDELIYGLQVNSQQMAVEIESCLLYTSPSPRDKRQSRMPSSA